MTFIPARLCLRPVYPRFWRLRLALGRLTRGFYLPPSPGRCWDCANCDAQAFWDAMGPRELWSNWTRRHGWDEKDR